jgi:hypothetical protein
VAMFVLATPFVLAGALVVVEVMKAVAAIAI